MFSARSDLTTRIREPVADATHSTGPLHQRYSTAHDGHSHLQVTRHCLTHYYTYMHYQNYMIIVRKETLATWHHDHAWHNYNYNYDNYDEYSIYNMIYYIIIGG